MSGYKIDFKLIEFLAKRYPTYSFILIGKVGEGDPWTDINNLKGLKNIYFLGSKPYSELPKYLKGIDVAILPNQINEYTDSMFPMKFFEYLSAGKPIVSVNLLAIQEYQEICYLSKDYDEFAKNLEKALNDSDDKLNKRLTIAKRFTYKSRTDKMMKIVERGGREFMRKALVHEWFTLYAGAKKGVLTSFHQIILGTTFGYITSFNLTF